MKKYSNLFILITSYFFVLLFTYASISKLLDFENFQVQIAQSPLLTAFAGTISYAVIILELCISLILLIPKTRQIALYLSFALMTAFTVYIYLILNYSEFVPCSCGGILEKLGWTEHLIFNIGCIILAGIAIILYSLQRGVTFMKSGLSLLIVLLLSSLTVVLLYLKSENTIKTENNFIRRFMPHPIVDEQQLNLKNDAHYFAGNQGDSIFLGNRNAPRILATVLPEFKKITIDTLFLSDYNLPFKAIDLNVTFPYLSLSDGTVPVLFEGNLPNKYAVKSKVNIPYYSKVIKVDRNNYIVKTTLSSTKEATIGTFNSDTGTLKLNNSLLQKQTDGLFDTDGDFKIDRKTDNIIYTYYYRNQYIQADLTLNNIERANTIDTTSIAKIQVTKLNDGVSKMSAPPLEVNSKQAAYGNQIFNISKLIGKFESKNRWKEADIVDVYDYSTKTYKYSFYIYQHNNHKVKEMLLTKNYLYVLSGEKLLKYKRRL